MRFQTVFRPLHFDLSELYDLVTAHNAVIAGGFCRYVANLREEAAIPDDVDIFTKTEEDFAALVDAMTKAGYNLTKLTKRSANFSKERDDLAGWLGAEAPFDLRYQIIKPNPSYTFETVEDLIEKFDLECCQIGMVSADKMVAADMWVSAEANRIITFSEIRNPLLTMKRVMKYYKKGYTIDSSTLMHIMNEWSALSGMKKDDFFTEAEQYGDYDGFLDEDSDMS